MTPDLQEAWDFCDRFSDCSNEAFRARAAVEGAIQREHHFGLFMDVMSAMLGCGREPEEIIEAAEALALAHDEMKEKE